MTRASREESNSTEEASEPGHPWQSSDNRGDTGSRHEMEASSPKCVAFDLWETLITETHPVSQHQQHLRLTKIETILRRCGVTSTTPEIAAGYQSLWTRCHELYWSADLDIPTRRQIEHLLEALAIEPASLSEEALVELDHAYAIPALEILPESVPGALETLLWCREQGLRIGLISNTGRTPGWVLRKILDRLGIGELLDTMIFSNEVGVCKPQSQIFSALCEGLGSDPETIVFVGDNLYADVWGAKRSGMKAVHFDPERRGLAVARETRITFEVVPDATVRELGALRSVLPEILS